MSPLCRHGKEVVRVSGTLDHWRHRDSAFFCDPVKPSMSAPQPTPEPCHICGGTEQFEGFCVNCPGPRCKNCGDVKRGHKLRDGEELCCPKATYFEPIEAAPQGVGKLSPETTRLIGKFDDDGGFRYSLGSCPRCKQELLLWFEQFKGGGTVIARVYHRGGNNHCKESK